MPPRCTTTPAFLTPVHLAAFPVLPRPTSTAPRSGRPAFRLPQPHRTSHCLHPAPLRASAAPPHGAAQSLRSVVTELAGQERGIFGLDAALREEIERHVAALEACNPTRRPTENNAAAAAGAWRLLYTTLTVLGRRRVRLAIGTATKPGFVQLGDLFQIIDAEQSRSHNIVVFRMAVGGQGTFTLTAQYKVVSDARVQVATESATLQPQKLEELLGENIGLLMEIFDPTGCLDITYVDDNIRIGRDDKGHIFVLERCDAGDCLLPS